jgi:hypothetical protein
VDQAARLRRREEARRRVVRQRRIVALTLVGLLAIAIAVLASGGSPARKRSAVAAPKLSELPRGGRTILPRYRVVAYYGAPQDTELGALGIGTPDQAVRKLVRQARPYGRGRPVMPALELIATVASGAPYDGGYRWRQPKRVIDRYLAAARRAHALLVLDIQPGRANFIDEVKRLQPYLEQPDVSLALDPEWHVGPGELPGKVIGSVEAADVNAISAYLEAIVRARHLPQKLLVVHQFTDDMIKNRATLVARPDVALTLNVDGFGSIPVKVAKYRQFTKLPPAGLHRGFKLFYHEDPVLMTPRAVLRLRPEPEFVVYE